MKDFRDRFRDPRWLDLRERILEDADGRCEGCGERSKVDVSIPFLVADIGPWEFPRSAYKVYCEICRASHKDVETEIKNALRLLDFDQLDRARQVLKHLTNLSDDWVSGRLDELIAVAKMGLKRYDTHNQGWNNMREVAESTLDSEPPFKP